MLNNLIDRIKLPFRKEKELYLALYDVLGFYPRKITYYKVALMHKSLHHRATAEEARLLDGKAGKRRKGQNRDEQRSEGQKGKKGKGTLGRPLNNERLEFLGDAILDAVVGDVVYQRFPGKPEGFLTTTRSKLVQRETLGRLAKEMGLTKLILAGSRTATHNSYMGGNAFEALVGAIYLDRGYEACQTFWESRVMKHFLNLDKMAYKVVNFKSKLLEWAQKNRVNVEFRLEDQTQDKHGSPTFVYTVVLEGLDGCASSGFSKKESQQKACELTLKKLRGDNKFLDSIFAAKTARTQMDEDPTVAVPDVEKQESAPLFISREGSEGQPETQENQANTQDRLPKTQVELEIDELSLDDVAAELEEKSREKIIEEAEAEAYK